MRLRGLVVKQMQKQHLQLNTSACNAINDYPL